MNLNTEFSEPHGDAIEPRGRPLASLDGTVDTSHQELGGPPVQHRSFPYRSVDKTTGRIRLTRPPARTVTECNELHRFMWLGLPPRIPTTASPRL